MTTTNRLRSTLVVLLSLTPVFGCGDDDDKNSSGVSSSKLLSEVTNAEAVKLCQFVQREDKAKQAPIEKYCTEDALIETDSESECKTFVKECVDATNEYIRENPDDDDEDPCLDTRASEADGCDVPVSEFESCVRALLQRDLNYYNDLSCSLVGEDVDFDESTPAACKKLANECPEFYQDL